jgi:adenosylcobinamide kinase/adenosylcobinamide-phosphate guanylyltransferase
VTERTGPSGPPGECAHRTLVLGGVRSGKSYWAEQELSGVGPVDYVATAAGSDDNDWAERIALHRKRRPASWRTVETLDLVRILSAPQRPLLIDDVGNWVARTIDATDGWDGDLDAYRAQADQLVDAWAQCGGRVVAVSNEVGSGVHPESRVGRIFRDELGRLNTALAARTPEVVLVIAGIPTWLRRYSTDPGAQS